MCDQCSLWTKFVHAALLLLITVTVFCHHSHCKGSVFILYKTDLGAQATNPIVLIAKERGKISAIQFKCNWAHKLKNSDLYFDHDLVIAG